MENDWKNIHYYLPAKASNSKSFSQQQIWKTAGPEMGLDSKMSTGWGNILTNSLNLVTQYPNLFAGHLISPTVTICNLLNMPLILTGPVYSDQTRLRFITASQGESAINKPCQH